MPPPPPVKKIKRPKLVLDEDSYTEALSHIIARDFFPGLLETETKQEYLDALDSKDSAWIASASRRLQNVMTPGRAKVPSTPRTAHYGGQTPRNYVGDTPISEAPAPSATTRLDTNMTLAKFQSTYTSEDNESFYQLVDKQNQKRAEKYAWLWRGNKLPSKQMVKQREVEVELAKTRSLIDDGFKRDRLAIKDVDHRPAQPDSWKANPRNGLMFRPDMVEGSHITVAQRAAEASRMGPRTIVYENTRMPEPHLVQRPPSPTASSIRDAVAGRKRDQDSSVAGGSETPRVNGYTFVDDKDDDGDDILTQPPPKIDLGPGDKHNPFKIQGQRKRELLHERMVDRLSKSKAESTRNGFTGKVEKTPAPSFPSSPRNPDRLTPAAQRLWSKMETPNRTRGDSFGQSTPLKSRGSLLRNASMAIAEPRDGVSRKAKPLEKCTDS